MDRRSFLRQMTAVGSCVLAGATTAECASPQAGHAATGGSTSTTESLARAPDWQKLAGSLSGSLLRPGDAGYPAAGHLYDALSLSDPAAIAQCASVSDVQRSLAFAREHGVELAVRSGGHSYAGYSSCAGLVIDVSPIQGVAGPRVSAGRSGASETIASVGAGTILIDVYSQLASRGLLLPGGSCPTVGIAGLALGGGTGVFSRAYGLTCDQMAGVDIVTADGVLRRCGPNQDEGLFWACRGGGGGNFGVVTSFDFAVQPIPVAIALFTLEWPWGAAASVLDAWIGWIPQTPDQLWANCQLYSSGVVGGGLVKVTGVFAGTVNDCAAALDPLTSAVGTATTYRFVGPENYLNATMIEAGCEGQPLAQCAAPVQSPFAAKSSYVSGPLPARVVNELVSSLSALPSTLPGAGGGVVFDAYGGAINKVAPSQTAFVHRDAVACAQYSITFPTASPGTASRAAASTWLDEVQQLFSPVSQGAYQNYIDPTLADWQRAYYGTNLPRLRQVKGKYDPDDVFRFAQSIPPESGRPVSASAHQT